MVLNESVAVSFSTHKPIEKAVRKSVPRFGHELVRTLY